MAHGLFDPVLPFETSKDHAIQLQSAGVSLSFHEYAIDHSLCLEEMRAFRAFLETLFFP